LFTGLPAPWVLEAAVTEIRQILRRRFFAGVEAEQIGSRELVCSKPYGTDACGIVETKAGLGVMNKDEIKQQVRTGAGGQ